MQRCKKTDLAISNNKFKNMTVKKINNKGQAKLFQNDHLEFLTKTHPFVIWLLYLPVFVLMPYIAVMKLGFSGTRATILFLSGIFFWTFTEYCLHRFLFHHQPKTDAGKRVNYLIHGNHHEYPRDKERLFMPPVPSLIIASCFFIIFYFIMKSDAFVFFPGFMFGYLLYGSMHYAIHALNPPFKWMKPLWRNHHLHHYKHEELGFGVSSTLWDHVFGTMYDLKNEKEDLAKVVELTFNKVQKI
jgi:sterol desaturase/sphingolipid hydroxylase (fatty acid hydroxylase superfamily)